MKPLRYRWLLRLGYTIDGIVEVDHVDDLFSNPPVIYKRSSKLVMRRGLSVRTIRFRNLTPEHLEDALREQR